MIASAVADLLRLDARHPTPEAVGVRANPRATPAVFLCPNRTPSDGTRPGATRARRVVWIRPPAASRKKFSPFTRLFVTEAIALVAICATILLALGWPYIPHLVRGWSTPSPASADAPSTTRGDPTERDADGRTDAHPVDPRSVAGPHAAGPQQAPAPEPAPRRGGERGPGEGGAR